MMSIQKADVHGIRHFTSLISDDIIGKVFWVKINDLRNKKREKKNGHLSKKKKQSI